MGVACRECRGAQSALDHGVAAAAVSFIGEPKDGEVGSRVDQGLDVPVRRAVSKCSEMGSVEKPSLDAGKATGAKPLREFAGEALRERVRQSGPPASDLLANSGHIPTLPERCCLGSPVRIRNARDVGPDRATSSV